MPGLLRGVARTAVAAGTFTAVSNRVSRRQGQRWAAQDEQQAQQQQPQYQEQSPPPAAPAEPDRMTQLKELGELKAQGVLTEEEFASEKARILSG